MEQDWSSAASTQYCPQAVRLISSSIFPPGNLIHRLPGRRISRSMVETMDPVSDPDCTIPDDNDLVQDIIYDMRSEDWKGEQAPETKSKGYVTLDVAFLAAGAGEVDVAAGPRMPVKKTLSRKGSHRGIERKAPESAATVATATSTTDAERSACLVHVVGEGDHGMLRLVTTSITGSDGGAGRFRRLAFRRPSPWLDPRRVLVFFATLSSMGTLILLYFTLSMGNILSGDRNAE